VTKASLQSISAALRYIECLRLDILGDIAGKDLHHAHTSPLSKDSTNIIVLSDDALTLTLRGADSYDDDSDEADALEFDNFSLGGLGIRWRRSADYIENETEVSTDELIQIVEKATSLLASIHPTAENHPPFRDKIQAAAQGGLWKVWIDAEARDVLPIPQF